MSENKQNKNSPRPSTSRFKLRVRNSAKKEEEVVNNGETTPNRHSTPIRRQNLTDGLEDSPEMDYRCSPIMGLPCTQQTEVAWNWHSPQGGTSPNEDIRTPKRSAPLQKRRIADSPLMYVPLKQKTKLRKEERDVDLFLANFEQFNNRMTVQEGKVSELSTSSNCQPEVQNRSNSDKNLETSDEGDMKLVFPDDETAMETVAEQRCMNLKDLLDDEIDDSMMLCSQRVEEEYFAQIEKQQRRESSPSVLPNGKENKESLHRNQIIGFQNLIKVPFKKPDEKIPTNSSVVKNEVISIPDDSFDECLSQFVEDDLNSASRKVTSPKPKSVNFYKSTNHIGSKKTLFPSENNNTSIKVGSSRSCSNIEPKRTGTTNGNSRVITKTRSFDEQRECCRFISKTVARGFVQKIDEKPETVESPRKFFKSKSYSETFPNNPKPSSVPEKNRTPEKNPSGTDSPCVRRVVGKSFKCKIFSDPSLNRSTGSGSSRASGSSQDCSNPLGNRFDNAPLSNLDRSVLRLHDQRTSDTQQVLCTKEEIERKRNEAKKKLEAKRRMMLSSSVTNSSRNLPISQSIKR